MGKLDLLGWVKASKYRTEVLLNIDQHTMPRDIQMKTDLRFTHFSRALSELTDKKLISLDNPTAKKGRLYSLTVLGNEIKNLVKRS